MNIKGVRRILKAFSDDTRLRIINLLRNDELSVTELCRTLHKNQSNISKHLTRLRLTGIVGDRRDGINVYYHLTMPSDRHFRRLLDSVSLGIKDLSAFKEDLKRLRKLRNK